MQIYAKHIARWMLSTFLRNICKEIDLFITWNRAEKQLKVLNEVYEEVSLLQSRRNAPPRLDYQPLFGKTSPHSSPRRRK